MRSAPILPRCPNHATPGYLEEEWSRWLRAGVAKMSLSTDGWRTLVRMPVR
jgi:hypothetical protein